MRFIVFGVTYLFFATHLLMCINYFWDKSKYPRIIWMRKSVTYSCFFYLVLCQRTEEKAALLSGTINPFSQWPKIASRVGLTRVPSPVLLHISNVSVCLDSYKRARRSLELIFKLYYFFFSFHPVWVSVSYVPTHKTDLRVVLSLSSRELDDIRNSNNSNWEREITGWMIDFRDCGFRR